MITDASVLRPGFWTLLRDWRHHVSPTHETSSMSGLSKDALMPYTQSAKRAVLLSGSDEDWDIWVRVFPESEEILVGSLGLGLVSR